ncbi:MAG: hypothetical protein V8T01_10485 [Oscillospiraceae bacterium]
MRLFQKRPSRRTRLSRRCAANIRITAAARPRSWKREDNGMKKAVLALLPVYDDLARALDAPCTDEASITASSF